MNTYMRVEVPSLFILRFMVPLEIAYPGCAALVRKDDSLVPRVLVCVIVWEITGAETRPLLGGTSVRYEDQPPRVLEGRGPWVLNVSEAVKSWAEFGP